MAAFIDKFQLTPEELVSLHGNKLQRDLQVTPDIFDALDKVQRIHQDCKILMQCGYQTIALDIMEQMTLHTVITQLNQSALFFLVHRASKFWD